MQLDEVLTALQSDSREDLKDLLDGLAGRSPRADGGRGPRSDPSARGQTAANRSTTPTTYIPRAKLAALVTKGCWASSRRDLARLIAGTAQTSAALIRNESALQGLITNFNITMAAFASEAGNLQTSIRAAGHAGDRQPRARGAQRGVPAHARVRARDPPGVRQTPATIAAAFPWIDQAGR